MSLQSRKIGYALGGGAARGLSHIGVLKVLDEFKVSPDIIVGTSMGAIIGALYAGGLKADDIEQAVKQLDWKRLALPTNMAIPLGGLTQGKRVISLLKSILGDITFSQLKHDFACVAADITTGEQVILHDGSLIEAVRASISIPGIFTPVMIDGRYLVDGGLVNEVPVSVCRVMGAGFVIGVNVLPEPSKIMCNPKRGRNYPACELLRLAAVADKNEEAKTINESQYPLASRLDDIRNAIKTLILGHKSNEQKKMLTSSESLQMGRANGPQPKAPSLVDVLTQSFIIAAYRVAMENLKDVDLVISPEVEDIGFWQFAKATHAIAAGEKAARYVLTNRKLSDVY